ncbi:unnamed protein product [Ostreobium quekettii]|uniref:Ferric reductase NAD binding domain-containing protein n=1 Tax=Ostreobium quekettii TaxID=121088 RepID=A0A8S1IY45_9CHLO|nr:unnamed protein product [Ostreobium quekettii]
MLSATPRHGKVSRENCGPRNSRPFFSSAAPLLGAPARGEEKRREESREQKRAKKRHWEFTIPAEAQLNMDTESSNVALAVRTAADGDSGSSSGEDLMLPGPPQPQGAMSSTANAADKPDMGKPNAEGNAQRPNSRRARPRRASRASAGPKMRHAPGQLPQKFDFRTEDSPVPKAGRGKQSRDCSSATKCGIFHAIWSLFASIFRFLFWCGSRQRGSDAKEANARGRAGGLQAFLFDSADVAAAAFAPVPTRLFTGDTQRPQHSVLELENNQGRMVSSRTIEILAPNLPRVFVDGPYGAPAQAYIGYSVVMLVGAGIGVTPFISILRDLLHRLAKQCPHCRAVSDVPGMKIERAYFHWLIPYQSEASSFEPFLEELAEEDPRCILDLNIHITRDKPPVRKFVAFEAQLIRRSPSCCFSSAGMEDEHCTMIHLRVEPRSPLLRHARRMIVCASKVHMPF